MSSKLVGVQIANLPYARTERRDVHRPRHPKRPRAAAAEVRHVSRVRSIITTTVQAIVRTSRPAQSWPTS
jgi:hypothetical protein